MPKRKVEFTLGVKYATGAKKINDIREIIKKVIGNMGEAVEFEGCYFKEFGNPGLNIEISYWIKSPEYGVYLETRHMVNLAIKEAFEKAGIEFDRA